jgi:hypothetical protein
MPISGLVVTLLADEATRARTKRGWGADARITVGPEAGDRVALVTEAPSLSASRDLAEEIAGLEGVALVEIVSVDLSDLTDTDEGEEEEAAAEEGSDESA